MQSLRYIITVFSGCCFAAYVSLTISQCSGYMAVRENMNDRDISSLTKQLPPGLYSRTIPKAVTDNLWMDPVYIYGAAFQGKSTMGILIALYCTENDIPFLYVSISEQDTCDIFLDKFGYRSNGWGGRLHRFVSDIGDQLFRYRCQPEWVFTSLREAAQSLV